MLYSSPKATWNGNKDVNKHAVSNGNHKGTGTGRPITIIITTREVMVASWSWSWWIDGPVFITLKKVGVKEEAALAASVAD